MSGGYTDFTEDSIQDHIWGVAAFTAPPNPFISLHSANPSENGANEIAGGTYIRQQITPVASSGGVITNSLLLRWDDLPAVTVTHWAGFDAVTAGNPLVMGALGGVRRYFTANATTEDLKSEAHGLLADDRVEFEQPPNGALPGGLAILTLYFVLDASGGPNSDLFRVSLTSGGAAINLTTDGSGTVISVTPKIIGAGESLEIAIGNLTHSVD